MTYIFNYKAKAIDLWKLTMYGTYTSTPGFVNIVFTVSMVLLCLRYWAQVNVLLKLLLVLGICLFTIIQPLLVYFKAKREAESLPKNIKLEFNEKGLNICTEEKEELITWKKIKTVSERLDMIIILLVTGRGFILSNDLIGKEKEDFLIYIKEHLKTK